MEFSEPVQILDHATQYILDEKFPRTPEESRRLTEDINHPLVQAIAILHRAKIEVDYPRYMEKAAMIIETHRRMEKEV